MSRPASQDLTFACRPARAVALLACLAAGAACYAPPPVAQAYLFEKGRYQAIYDPSGRLLRLLYDSNADRTADVVVLYEVGVARRIEIDTDADGAIDRWELYGRDSKLARVGSARRRPGQADLWEHLGAGGRVIERELDDDGDGRSERRERYGAAGLEEVQLDSDGDGRFDRWQRWQAQVLTREDLDTDGDGEPDRRLRFDRKAPGPKLEKLGRAR